VHAKHAVRYGQRTPAFLDELGYLDDNCVHAKHANHLTEATDDEAALIAQRGARMALCSGSIGVIDGIVPPAHAFRSAGGLVALGSDQASGNNCVYAKHAKHLQRDEAATYM